MVISVLNKENFREYLAIDIFTLYDCDYLRLKPIPRLWESPRL